MINIQGFWSLILVVLLSASAAPKSPLEITYIANCGFLIECADKKIVVDGFFGTRAEAFFRPSDSIVQLMKTASPPFDSIDIILVTHAHVDHFDADIVAEHLKHNARANLICTPQAAVDLNVEHESASINERVYALDVPVDSIMNLEFAGVNISAIGGKHSSYIEEDSTGMKYDRHEKVQHLEFVVTVGGRTIYHSGDAPLNDRNRYRSLGFGAENIDLAFVAWWDEKEPISFRQKLIKDFIRPERIILMHMYLTRPPRGDPEKGTDVAGQVILPRNLMEKWVLE